MQRRRINYPGDMNAYVNDAAVSAHIIGCDCEHCRQPEAKEAARETYRQVVNARLRVRRFRQFMRFGVDAIVDDADTTERIVDDVLDKAKNWRYN